MRDLNDLGRIQFVLDNYDSAVDGGYHYFPITNDATVESSAARIRENGYDSVLRDWTASVRNGQTGAELAVTGQLLYDAAVKGGL